MKKLLFQILSFTLCFCMIFTLSACGEKQENTGDALLDFGDETGEGLTKDESTVDEGNISETQSGTENVSSNSTGESDASNNTSDNDPFANIPSRLRGTTVTFACWGDEGNSAYKPMLDAFTKKTGIKVKIENVEQSSYMSTVQQKIVAGKGPDIIMQFLCLTLTGIIQKCARK